MTQEIIKKCLDRMGLEQLESLHIQEFIEPPEIRIIATQKGAWYPYGTWYFTPEGKLKDFMKG
jgi:hypothetical protein